VVIHSARSTIAGLKSLGETIGNTTTALLVAERLDPRDYANSRSYCKALGLNLKERSSGQHKGQLKSSNGVRGLPDETCISPPCD
jgi:hypothetical protein